MTGGDGEGRSRWGLRLGLAGVSLLVGVALFEVGARVLDLDYDLSPNWKYHPVLGWSQIPGARYDTVIEGRPVRVSFNAAGSATSSTRARSLPE